MKRRSSSLIFTATGIIHVAVPIFLPADVGFFYSCARTVNEVLFSLSPPPTRVDVSIIHHSVTVEYVLTTMRDTMQSMLEDAGFDIFDLGHNSSQHTLSDPPGIGTILSDKHRKHIQQCLLCQEAGAVDDAVSPSKVLVDNMPHLITLSIGGMTCSSCPATITEMVSPLPGISEVVVSLLNHSATVVVARRDLVPSVTETIDDCGYEVEVIKVEPFISSASGCDKPKTGLRNLLVRVDGMYCQWVDLIVLTWIVTDLVRIRDCPAKIMTALQKLQPEVTVVKPISNYMDPIMEVCYEPSPPDFTIRSIISAIVSAEPTSFSVSIYHPPTLEQRTRCMQLHEQRTLLLRLFFTFIIAIPTFIIGVVYISLVPSSSRTRKYLMAPMWNGNASRFEWALFFLATPVYFYGAGLFHRRSIKEIRLLWKKGSTTPIIKRFTRFGSMNLLVCTHVHSRIIIRSDITCG